MRAALFKQEKRKLNTDEDLVFPQTQRENCRDISLFILASTRPRHRFVSFPGDKQGDAARRKSGRG